MPIHVMSCLLFPMEVVDDLQSLSTRVYCSPDIEEQKMCWCAWDFPCKCCQVIGYWFRDIEAFNKVKLAKQRWCFIQEPNSLIVKHIFQGKHFCPDTLLCVKSPLVFGCVIWKALLTGRDILYKGGHWRIGETRMVPMFLFGRIGGYM